MTRYTSTILASMALATVGTAQTTLINFNFDADTVGTRPTQATAPGTSNIQQGDLATSLDFGIPAGTAGSGVPTGTTAGANPASVGVVVFNNAGSVLGTTNSLRVFDNHTNSTTNYRFAHGSTGNSGLYSLSLNFAHTGSFTSTAASAGALRIAWGSSSLSAGAASSASWFGGAIFSATNAGNSLQTGFNATGAPGAGLLTVNAANNQGWTNYVRTGNNSLKIFINDSNSSTSYIDGANTFTLAAHEYDIWLNGTRRTVTTLGDEGVAMLAVANRTGGADVLTHFAIGSAGGTNAGDDWLVDNIVVNEGFTAIPEPSSYAALAGMVAVAIIGQRRRRK